VSYCLLLCFDYHNDLKLCLSQVVSMNFEEVMNLLRTFSSARFKDSAEVPKVHVYDNQTAGYVLWTKANSDIADYDFFVRDLAEKQGFKVREYNGYLIIYSL
jgi:hypothetical protein